MHNTIALKQQNTMIPPVATEPKIETQPVSTEAQRQERIWAKAAQAGDQVAYMQIVNAYQRPVYNLCYRMLHDSAEAEDAAQETFIRVYTKIESYNPSRKFSSWILSIASHYCIDLLRKRRFQVVSWDDLPPWRWFPSSDPQPEEVALADESKSDLHQLVQSLPPDYRAATILRYWHEMSYDEIAETLDTTVSTIKSRLFRAKKMMAKTVKANKTPN
ncbi:sigma-70 family RNA polymerase sigma factor [Anaerolineales bacterium HSG6]|nr:sigma-70 family RNA polymerase sigma factor [Anaerolineales bacterium HSG6]